MKGVRQTIFVGPEGDTDGAVGNCLQACVASLVEAPLDKIPHFAQDGDNWGWWAAMRRWARSWGADFGVFLDLAEINWGDSPKDLRFLIASGPSPRGPYWHAVIVDEHGALAWDPHPSGDGLAGAAVEYKALLSAPYDPHPDDQLAQLQAESAA